MRYPIYIETPFGDFQFAETNLNKGCSCSQCVIRDLGMNVCHLMPCGALDDDTTAYHLVRRL